MYRKGLSLTARANLFCLFLFKKLRRKIRLLSLEAFKSIKIENKKKNDIFQVF